MILNTNEIFDEMKQAVGIHQMVFDENQNPIDYVYLYVNQAFSDLLQWPKEKVIGAKISELMPSGYEYWVKFFGTVATTGNPEYVTQISSPLNNIYEIMTFSPKYGQFIAIFKSVKEKLNTDTKLSSEKEYLQKLQTIEDQRKILQLVLDSAAIEIMWTDKFGNFTYVNQFALDILGYTREEFLSLRIIDIDAAHPIEKWAQNWEKLKNQKTRTIESIHKTKNGRIFPVIIHQNYIKYKDMELNFAIIQDISVIKHTEEKLRESQRLESIGRLAGGVAHDFNNILSGILGYAQLIQFDESSPISVRENAEAIIHTSERAADLVQQLLGMARKGKSICSPIYIHDSLEEVLKTIKPSLLKGIKILKNYSASQVIIHGDPNQILRMFLNLILNALDAMPDGGNLTIATDNLIIGKDEQEKFPDLLPNLYICIKIEDTGIGISKENLSKLFEPFFTTKQDKRGTGLGLSVVWGVVKNHDGTIQVKSELQKGTTFEIYFPVTQEDNIPMIKVDTVGLKKGHGTILLVDDEPFIRKTGEILLQYLGYKVITADNGKKALEIYQKQPKEIAVVILDMIMPEMDGKTCFFRIREINPNQQIILASGYSLDRDLNELKEKGMCHFISKPYRIEVLSQLLSSCNDNEESKSNIKKLL